MPDANEAPHSKTPNELKKEDITYTPEGVRKVAHFVIQKAVEEKIGDGELLKTITGFDAGQFARGLTDSILDTGENLGALAYNLYAHPDETVTVILKDLEALKNNPQVLVEAGLIASDSFSAWWEKTVKEKGSGASYDMGKLVGLLEARLLTQGFVTVMDTPGHLEPAIGPKGRVDLMSDLFTEQVLARVEAEMPEANPVLRPLFQEMNRHMQQTQSPLEMDAFVETMKNLSLFQKYPATIPLKKSSVTFLRDQLLDAFYKSPQTILIHYDIQVLLRCLSGLIQAVTTAQGALIGISTTLIGVPFTLYTKTKLDPKSLQVAEQSLASCQAAVAANKTPAKQDLLSFTDTLINNSFA